MRKYLLSLLECAALAYASAYLLDRFNWWKTVLILTSACCVAVFLFNVAKGFTKGMRKK